MGIDMKKHESPKTWRINGGTGGSVNRFGLSMREAS